MAEPGETAVAETDAAVEMDRTYRYQRLVYDVTRKYYLLGRDRLIHELDPPAGGNVLEIACGTGRNLIQAARRYRDASFFGLDVSAVMLDVARRSIQSRGLSQRIRLVQADATNFDPKGLFGIEKFDRICISYAVSMVPAWQAALAFALTKLAPAGSLHVVDFGQDERLPGWFRTALFAWLRRFHVTPRADLESSLARMAGHVGMQSHFKKLYGGYAYYAVLRPAQARELALS